MVVAFETLCGLCPPDTDGFSVGVYELGRAWSGSGQLHPTTVARRLGRFQDLGLVTYSIAAGVVTLRLSDPRGVVQRPIGAALGWARRKPPRLGMSAQPQRGLPFVKPEDDQPALGVVGIAGDRRPADNPTSGNEDARACVSTDGNARAPTDGNARACISIPPPEDGKEGGETPRKDLLVNGRSVTTSSSSSRSDGDDEAWRAEAREVYDRLFRPEKRRPTGQVPQRDRRLIFQLAVLRRHPAYGAWVESAIQATEEGRPDNPFAYIQGCLEKLAPPGVSLQQLRWSVPIPPQLLKGPRHAQPTTDVPQAEKS